MGGCQVKTFAFVKSLMTTAAVFALGASLSDFRLGGGHCDRRGGRAIRLDERF